MCCTQSTYKRRRGNVHRTLNANANVREFSRSVTCASLPSHPAKILTDLLHTFHLWIPYFLLASFADNFSTHDTCVSLKLREGKPVFTYLNNEHSWESFEVEISSAWMWQIASLPTPELLALYYFPLEFNQDIQKSTWYR